jgi:hypothetical protein
MLAFELPGPDGRDMPRGNGRLGTAGAASRTNQPTASWLLLATARTNLPALRRISDGIATSLCASIISTSKCWLLTMGEEGGGTAPLAALVTWAETTHPARQAAKVI